MKINVIITGSSGMVGKGVLLQCIESDNVESILVINRQPIEIKHSKIREIVHKDFYDLTYIQNEFEGYNACFFCLGVSSFRMSEESYSRITYDLTMNFAKKIFQLNNSFTFCYVSGKGTDSSEEGRSMWARIKGKTENAILNIGFKSAYMFRPGYIQPIGDIKSKTPLYNAFLPVLKVLYPLIKSISPKYVTTTKAIGDAMINVVMQGYDKKHLENVDINKLAIL